MVHSSSHSFPHSDRLGAKPYPLLCSSILPFVLACQIKIFPPSSRPLSEEAVSQCHSAALAGKSRIDDHDVRVATQSLRGRGEAFETDLRVINELTE
jgi:hypothetical protein